MSRLCDYVVISGYDHTKSVTADPKQSNSEVIQRFPVKVSFSFERKDLSAIMYHRS